MFRGKSHHRVPAHALGQQAVSAVNLSGMDIAYQFLRHLGLPECPLQQHSLQPLNPSSKLILPVLQGNKVILDKVEGRPDIVVYHPQCTSLFHVLAGVAILFKSFYL
jgi:hypothetical protein